MNRSSFLSILALVGFFSILLGLFTWSRYLEHSNYLDPMEAEQEIARQEAGVPTSVTLPPIRSSDPSRGSTSTNALLVVEFADFNCLYCRLVEPEIRRAMQAFPTEARLVWRDLPLNAEQADGLLPSIAARCAQDQGKFWEMHDALFATAKLDRKGIRTAAENAKLELAQFDTCLASNKHADALRAEINLARTSGITGSPTLFVGTQVVSGFIKAQELADLMGQLIARKSATP
ncbi:thioredoxin domain-containing protein [Patescibacteria group bacterium]|nr:thioredoxin domain-containing protein [Patescibacteria group bacterium]